MRFMFPTRSVREAFPTNRRSASTNGGWKATLRLSARATSRTCGRRQEIKSCRYVQRVAHLPGRKAPLSRSGAKVNPIDTQDAIHGCPRGCRGASPSSGLPAAVRQDKTATRMGPGLPARNRAVERIAANRSGAGCRHEARPCTSCRGHKAGAPSTSRRREGARLRPGELSRRREGRVPNGLRRRGATRCCRCRGSRNGSER